MLSQGFISQFQLNHFKTKEPSLSIDQSAYICDEYTLPENLSFPFKLSFTAAFVCKNGEFTIRVNQRELEVKQGDFIIILNGSIIEKFSHSPDLDTMAMAFPPTNEDWIFNKQIEKVGAWLIHCSIPMIFHLDESLLQKYYSCYLQIKELYTITQDEMKDEIVRGFLSISIALFLSGSSIINIQEPINNSRKEEIFLRFMDDLQLYASKERAVQFYADRACISAKHFSRVIFQASGILPIEHIKQRVIIESKTLLRTTEMTIREIADALNFPNDSYFCRYFKHDTGLSPSEYRAKEY